jgi:hypothetical protein
VSNPNPNLFWDKVFWGGAILIVLLVCASSLESCRGPGYIFIKHDHELHHTIEKLPVPKPERPVLPRR